MRLDRILSCLGLAAALVAANAADPDVAQACGGTFCDAGPAAMPVDQSGENILFVVDGPDVEAHVQIQVDPDVDADRFAWVIPVRDVPAFSVGSEPLFQALLSASVPSYGLSTNSTCGGSGGDGGNGSGIGFISSPDGGGAGPTVELRETVGAFEVVVLSGGSTQEIVDWLNLNGFAQDPAATPILDQYLSEGFLFAAFRLGYETGVEDVHPIVMRYPDDGAGIPLRLTRIAAQEDMEVRTFFLADERVAPTNYKHVLVNPLKIDWFNQAINYKDVISAAVDGADPGGKAFVTEFAGSSGPVNTAQVFDASWDAAQFMGIAPEMVVGVLQDMNLMGCGGDECFYGHPLVRGLLTQYLPIPAGLTEGEFYGCLECHSGLIDPQLWDADGFAIDFQVRIVDPGLHARDLLATWPYLTRMYTTISPEEMTDDPIFHPHPGLGDVQATRIANQDVDCDGNAVVTLPDGRQVYVPAGFDWPTFGTEMPWVEDSQEMPDSGAAPIAVIDNTARIDELLAAWNAAHGWPPVPGGTGGEGETGSGPGPAGTDGAGSDSTAGLSEPTSSCACRSDRRDPTQCPTQWWLVPIVIALRPRRRR